MTLPGTNRIQKGAAGWQNRQRIRRLASQVDAHSRPDPGMRPLVLFNASTRLTGLSLNAAFQLVTGWSLRLSGVPVIQWTCQAGMSHCVLGTNREDHTQPPPCSACRAQTDRLYSHASQEAFHYTKDEALEGALQGLTMDQLGDFCFPLDIDGRATPLELPLGRLTLPSMRWALRMFHFADSEANRYLLRAYISSAYSIAREFSRLLARVEPVSVLVFNGMIYPEQTARYISKEMGYPTYAHEVGFQRYSAFFTDGHPTAYPIDIPADFELTAEQNQKLDSYLEKRFQGQFSMAGIRFWPEMRGLDEEFLQRAARFKQIVPVFTNVVYDTSQIHANVVFPQMFAWLDLILELVRSHPETLFVIRAHPDEMRPNSKKLSRESVREWVQRNRLLELPNLVFINSQEYISSYELIQRSKFVMVYNSSIGLEATLLGAAVLCGGKARYTQYPIVYFPESQAGYRECAESFLNAGSEGQAVKQLPAPADFQRNARRFLYYQLYRTSLPFDAFIEESPRQGFVQLRAFPWQALQPDQSATLQIIRDGLLHGNPFLVDEPGSTVLDD